MCQSSLTAALGSMGYAVTASGVSPIPGAYNGSDANAQFNFPSIYLFISSSPLLIPKTAKKTSEIDSVQDGDRDIKWMDATFTIDPLGSDGNSLGNCGQYVQILGLLPNQTEAALKTPVANTVATTANQLVSATTPFVMGVGAVAGGATDALQVLFNALFPPKADAYLYSWMDGPCTFGWYFKGDANATPPVSVLGTQTGIVLLRTDSKVATLHITSKLLSQWTKSPAKTEQHNFLLVTPDAKVQIPTIKVDALPDLSAYPILIPKEQVMKILHIPDADTADWMKLVAPATGTPALVTTTADHTYVTKGSLQTYLGISGSPPSPSSAPQMATPTPASH